MNSHTPGPWRVGIRPGPIVYGQQGEQVANLHVPMVGADENRANARLIAAAPEMLAALEACIPWLGKAIFYDLASLPVESPREDLSKLLSMACSAVAKAGGRKS